MITYLTHEDLSIKDLDKIGKWKYKVTGSSPNFELNNLPEGLIQEISIVLKVENGKSIKLYWTYGRKEFTSSVSSQTLKPGVKYQHKFVLNLVGQVNKIRLELKEASGTVEIEKIKIFYLPPELDQVSEETYRKTKYILRFQSHCDKHLPSICDPLNKSVLVIGAGYGTEMLWCIRNGAKEVIGIDVIDQNTDPIKIALEQMEINTDCDFEIRKMGVEEIESLGRKFDIILSNNVFEHLPDVKKSFNACKNMIKPYEGRIAVFTDPLWYSSTGSHIPLLDPWEHLWNPEIKITEDEDFIWKYLQKELDDIWNDYSSLNRIKLSEFIQTIESTNLVILKLDIIPDRNLEKIKNYISLIKNHESITNLAMEGISIELMSTDSNLEEIDSNESCAPADGFNEIDKYWEYVIRPIIEKIDTDYIVDIGPQSQNTRDVLEYCIENNIRFNLIDPFLDKYSHEIKGGNSDEQEIITKSSLISLSQLENYDVVILNDEPNWFTVYNELKIIEKRFKNKKFPIVFLNNIGWPYARRDLYIEPNKIPNEYRQPYRKLGVDPKHSELKEEGGLNPNFYHAIHENGANNGVLTAIENFIAESESEFSLEIVNVFQGLGILFVKNQKLGKVTQEVLNNIDFLRIIEQERMKLRISQIESGIEEVKKKNVHEKTINEIKTKISFLESQLDNKEAKLEKTENLLNKTETSLKEKEKRLNHAETSLKEKEEQLNLSNHLIQITENQLEQKEKNDEIFRSQLNNLTSRIYEMNYSDNRGRSVTQRLISKFPSLYILFSRKNRGIKNALRNIKGFRAIKKNHLFDIGFYLKNNGDVQLSGTDPVLHYIYHGYKEGRNPSSEFDGHYYLMNNPDIRNMNLNPLIHYSLYGLKEERKTKGINTDFSADKSIRGSLDIPKNNEPLIKGWVAKIGDENPRTAILSIDDEDYEVECNIFRSDLKETYINEGYHAFEFAVPLRFIDGKRHYLKLFDKASDELIDQEEFVWRSNRRFKDFSGFLRESLLSPLLEIPFREEDKRCFGIMENIAKYLMSFGGEVESTTLVSVIMPVYNRIDTVKNAVDSVLGQTYQNFELIIIDDGSEDGSNELLKKFNDERIILLENESCQGVSKARNRGLESANGEYIMYLDSDNLWDPRYISTMVGAFTMLSDAEALYGGQLLFRGGNDHPFAVRFGSFNRSLLTNRNYIDLNAFCHKQALYKRVGGFDETLNRYVDWDLILRISESAIMYSVPVLLSHYYYDQADNTLTKDENLVYNLDILREKLKERLQKRFSSTLKLPKDLSNRVSIVIPSYQSLDDIQECIDSILTLNLNEWLEIIVVDNASNHQTVDYLTELESMDKIKLILNDINYGFTYAVNQGINLAEPENDIIILNNDAILTPGSIEAMQKAAYELPQCGLICPQQVLYGGTKTINTHVPYANPKYDCDVNLSAFHSNVINIPLFHAGDILELNFAPFFCVYIKREVLNNSLGLDPELGRHYRSDRIFCDYIRQVMNLKIYYISSAIVYHKLQKSTDVLKETSDKKSHFDIIFGKNQWDDELKTKLGYKTPLWDI